MSTAQSPGVASVDDLPAPAADPGGAHPAPADRAVDTPDDDAAPAWLLPLWCEAFLVVLAALVVGVGGAGLLLAVLGRYGLAPALLWGLLVAVLAGGPALARLGRHRDGRSAHLPTAAMVVVAVVSAVLNARWAAESVFVTGDDGIYAVAGRWIADHGSLQVPSGASLSALGPLADPGSVATYADAGGSLEFPADHLFPVLLALAHDLGGDRAAAAANAVIGALALLAVYAVGVRLCRHPWLVVAAVTTLGMSLPQLQAGRDTLSEPLTQLLLWTGLWLLLTAWERRNLGLAALAGLTLGATLTARIDALLYLALLPVVAGLACAAARERRRLVVVGSVVVLAAAVPTALLAAVDLRQRGTPDSGAFRVQVEHLLLLAAAATVVGVVLAVVGGRVRPGRGPGPLRAVAAGAGVLVALGLVVAWALRPAVQQLRGAANPATAALQAHEFIPAAPELTYSEYTLTWFSWYLGPVALALAVVGAGLLTRAAIRGGAAALLVLAAVGPAAVRYLYAVSATPDQIDVMQRFVPAVLPGFALAAVLGLEALAVVATRAGRPSWGRTALALGAVAFVVFPLARLAPVHAFRDEDGYLAAVDRVCGAIGPRAAVVFAPDDQLSTGLAQTLRSYCEVPVTRFVAAPGPSGLTAAAQAAQAQGRTLWVLGGSQASVTTTVGADVGARQLASATNTGELESTLSRPPEEYVSETLAVWGAVYGLGRN